MLEGQLVSFVVIAYNEAGNIARTLCAINALDGLSSYEVIVVDDGSRDETAQIVTKIAAENPCVRLVRLAQNHGRGYARSRGIAEANGQFIATVDADITLPPDWLLRAQAALNGHDAVGGTAVPDGDVAYIHKRFRLVPRLVGHTTSVTGSNALYRREVFAVAEFDPSLREGEDVALNHATKARGLSFATVPGLLVAHEENKTFGESLRWLFESGGGATRQLITYRVVRQPDLAAGGFVVAAALGLLATARGHRLIGVAVPVGFVTLASVQHVRSRFETPVADWPRLAPAVAADGALLTVYFFGRIVGLSRLREHRQKYRSSYRHDRSLPSALDPQSSRLGRSCGRD